MQKENKKKRKMNDTDPIVNLTPHDVVVFGDNGMTVTYHSCGEARARSTPQTLVTTLRNGVQIFSAPSFCGVSGFPFDGKDGMHPNIIVSMVVGKCIPSSYQGNVYVPDTGPGSAVRDEKGKIKGVKRLYIVHECP